MSDIEASPCVVLTTCPDRESAARLAEALVAARVAACVSVGAPARSTYPWQGAIRHDDELPLTIKTDTARLADLETVLRRHHPYEVPEMLALPVIGGHEPYLEWMKEWLHG